MNRAAWIDTGIGLAVIGLTAALGVIGAYLAPESWHATLYVLCIAGAVLTTAQTLRAVRGALHHERTFAELREGQAYLAQPEINRQFDALFRQHDEAVRREDLFQSNFDCDSTKPGATVVSCKHCDWRLVKALAYAREDALQHHYAWHSPPEAEGRARWRRLLRV